AGHHHRPRPFARKYRRRLRHRARGVIAELREAHHPRLPSGRAGSATPAEAAGPAPAATRPISIGLRAPPSQGTGTRIGSGHRISGTSFGPYRFAGDSIAFRIFSGVTGTSSMRTPTAS